jgi:hypothetical protein
MRVKRVLAAALTVVFVLGTADGAAIRSEAVTAYSAGDPYYILANGTTVYQGVDYKNEYNALDYYLNYPDLQAAFGANAFALVEHYAVHGRFEGRIANRMLQSSTILVPSGKDGVSIINVVKHDNGGMTAAQETTARSIAAQIATNIKKIAEAYASSSESGGKSKSKTKNLTQVELAAYAAGCVKAYLDRGTQTATAKNSNNAYGVFVTGQYNSAGATRALGLVLDYLGITWEHANIGTSGDQWCKLVINDGTGDVEGYADATAGEAGTGKSSKEGGDGKAVSFADVRKKFNVYK